MPIRPLQHLVRSAILMAVLASSSFAQSLIEKKSKTHWAFQPVAKPQLPRVGDNAWAKAPIDSFVLAKLEANNLSPSPPADRATLLRRAHLTLIGLPPTYEETQAFLRDDSPDAFANVVDRLLASPHYGERWGRHWLDVARYADTKGYVFQEARQYPYAYTFRDWVIRALNEDMPYDQFLTYQIAADKLAIAEDQKKHLAAMGFLTVGRRFLNRQPDIIDDRIDVVTRGTMALTVACSRCHDHKYDPIPTADYYSLYGVFASSEEPKQLPLLGKQPVTPETEAFDRELRIREAKVDKHLQKRLDDQRKEEQLKRYLIAVSDGKEMNDGELKKLASDRGLVQSFLLRWRNFLNESKKEPFNPVFAPWNACCDLPPARFAEEAPKRLAPILENKELNPRVTLALKDKKLESINDLAAAYAKLFAHDNQKEPHEKPAREQVRQILYAKGTPNDVSLEQLYRELPTPDQERVRKFRREVEKHKAEHPGAPPRGMVMVDRARPSEPYVFIRGQQGNRGPKVPRQFPAIAAGAKQEPFPKDSSGRLEMAKLIASKDNPLTARVIVNRVWLQHFGKALVSTPSDFGLRSDPPSHPQLLDYLAHRFMEEGWSLKKLHRHILLSATFQQSSAHDPKNAAKDPENQFFWRMNRQRLDFEAMRDSLVQASGQLDRKMFGRPYPISKSPFVMRRTVYSEIERQNLDNVFRTFDFASPDAHCPQRHQTSVPQQALFMMNSPFLQTLAAQLASSQSILQAHLSPEEKVRQLYHQIFSRDPDAEELRIGIAFLDQPAGTNQTLSAWSYGYGSFEDGRVNFSPLQFVSNRYQGGAKLPDPTTGWASLHKTGGHPGHGKHYKAVLRWTAPEDGNYIVDIPVEVPAQMSDGVVVSVVANGRTEFANSSIPATQKEHVVRANQIALKKGGTIDLIVGGGKSINHDSFNWNPMIVNKSTKRRWLQNEEFTAPRKQVPSLQQYIQALLSTNEFAFVD